MIELDGLKFEQIEYRTLNPKAQETYNFHKMAAILADYGYNCLWLNDDWNGADCIAVHIDGISDFKSQLKDAVSYAQKYRAKQLYIAFFELSNLCIDAHNFVLHKWKMIFQTRRSWKKAHISKPKLPKDLEKFLSLIKFLKQTRLFLPCFHYIRPSLCFFTRCQKHRDVYSFVLQPLKII